MGWGDRSNYRGGVGPMSGVNLLQMGQTAGNNQWGRVSNFRGGVGHAGDGYGVRVGFMNQG